MCTHRCQYSVFVKEKSVEDFRYCYMESSWKLSYGEILPKTMSFWNLWCIVSLYFKFQNWFLLSKKYCWCSHIRRLHPCTLLDSRLVKYLVPSEPWRSYHSSKKQFIKPQMKSLIHRLKKINKKFDGLGGISWLLKSIILCEVNSCIQDLCKDVVAEQ